jgi:diguanylate cyclase (GGDEF)-like protein/PAS domain S-box-containing protein
MKVNYTNQGWAESEQLRLVADMPVMLIAYDKNLRCLFASRRFAEFFGLATASTVGKHLREIIGEVPYQEVKPYFDRVLEGHCAIYRRTRVLDSGELRDLEVELVPDIGQDGRTWALFAVTTDVTERKRAEAALREQEEFFRLIAENIGDFIAVLDLDGRRLYNSPSYQRFFGDTTDLHGTNSFAEVHPEDRQRVEQVFRETVQSGIGHQIEYRFVSEGGEIRHMESRGAVIRDKEGRVARVVVVSQDITERKRAEQALRDSAEKLRLFAENVPAMAASYDENLRCRFANKAFADFFGFTVENLLGKHLREVAGEEAYREIKGHFVQVLQGHPVTYQTMHKFPNGEFRYLEVKLLPQFGDQGKVLGCFTVTTDITEYKLAEERIQRMAHHDSLTGLPNRLLFNDRLEQAISLAKRGSRQFTLLYLDLDRFKPVNDTLGHTAGDELLQAVAARIRQQVRESDTVARVGGDEFTVILPDIARREEAETVAKKIIAALAAPFQLGSQKQSVEIGTSIGIAIYPTDARDTDALLNAADAAMYGAKQIGSNFRFCGT